MKKNFKSTLKKIKIYMKNLRKNSQPEEDAKLASWDIPSNTSNKDFWFCQKNYSKKETTAFLFLFSTLSNSCQGVQEEEKGKKHFLPPSGGYQISDSSILGKKLRFGMKKVVLLHKMRPFQLVIRIVLLLTMIIEVFRSNKRS